jgi:UDP-N-acetylmuramate dehydrogenase
MTFIGNGTKTLVRDGGLRGIVMKLGDVFEGIELEREEGDALWVKVGAKTEMQGLNKWVAARGVADLDGTIKSRGTVAGEFMINPARFVEFMEELTIVEKSGREVTLTRKAVTDGERIRFGRSAAITAMKLKFKKSENPKTDDDEEDSFSNERARLIGVFKNVGKQTADTIIADANMSGIRVGRVRIDDRNTNCFVNEGNARAKDAVILIGLIKDRVKQSQGVQLEVAVRVVGEE